MSVNRKVRVSTATAYELAGFGAGRHFPAAPRPGLRAWRLTVDKAFASVVTGNLVTASYGSQQGPAAGSRTAMLAPCGAESDLLVHLPAGSVLAIISRADKELYSC
jgi:hypothetical protein